MTIGKRIAINLVLISAFASAQNFRGIYKIDRLLSRIDHQDTLYVINFWATWCKPCVQELPSFDSLHVLSKNKTVKVILVSLDFSEDTEKKVKPFLLKQGIRAECILLDEVNGNNFISKISSEWTGAIPATLFKKGDQQKFVEKKMNLKEIEKQLDSFH